MITTIIFLSYLSMNPSDNFMFHREKILADFKENNQLNIEKIIELYNPYIYTILKNCLSKSEDIFCFVF